MCKNEQNKEGTKSIFWIWIVIAIIGVIALWGLSWWGINKFIDDPTDQGTFGDMFGAVNALFSGLAFAGLIVTLLYQKEELKLQREELAQTREELKGQREEFEEQNKTMKRQRFENTFFNMLSLQQEIVANLSYDEVERVMDFSEPLKTNVKHTLYNGRNLFRELYLKLRVSIPNHHSYTGIKRAIQANGYGIYSDISSTTRFDHYFRHLYHIIKYVDTNDLIADEERYDYVCIIRSQLSDYELVMLFYNCLTTNGREKFKPLIEKYTIFNNLRTELLAHSQDVNAYSATAFNRHIE